MYLRKLSLAGFKNYKDAELEFCDKINCFAGDNGSGKTNLLDAIHYLSFTKSYFNLVDQQNIMIGEEFFRIQGQYAMEDATTETVECLQKKNQRKILKISKKEYERMADHIGLFPLVMISPADSNLIYNGSEDRRKFIDSVISQFNKVYLDDLINYQKALMQRNKLLKYFAESRTFKSGELEVWNEPLIRLGARIYEKRLEFMNNFKPVFGRHFQWISGGKEEVDILYETDLHHEDFEHLLQRSLEQDRIAGFSTAGIHKDDLVFTIKGMPLKKFGSQGQQKSFLLAIRLAQFDYTRDTKGFKPLLLLDDIFDKLDDFRVEQLIRLVSEDHFGQIFITDTSAERLSQTITRIHFNYKLFNIQEGRAEEAL